MNEELKIIISAETAKLKSACSDAKNQIGDLAKDAEGKSGKVKEAFSKIGSAAKVVAGACAAVGAAMAVVGKEFAKGIKETAEYGDNIDKMSQKMNMSAEGYQEWNFVMQHCGTSMESMKASMKTLSNAAVDGSEAFAQLGMSQAEIANMSSEELFDATITALQNVEDETQRTALASQLLGKGATELGAVFNMSAEETAAMKQQLHDMGGVMSNDAIKNAAAFKDSLQNLKASITGVKNGVFAEFLPSVTTVMDGLTMIFSGDADSGLAKINEGITGFVNTLSSNLPKIANTASSILSTIIKAIIDNLPQIMKCGVDMIVELVKAIVSSLPMIIKGIIALVNAIVEALPDILMAIVDVLPELIPAILDGIIFLVATIIKNLPIILQALFNTVLQLVTTLFTTLKDTFGKYLGKAKDWMGEKITEIVNKVETVFNKVKDKITKPFTTAKDKIKEIVDKIKGFFNFEAQTPKLKLPHFTITPQGWKLKDLLQGSIPKLSISWYAQGGVFEKPALFGYGNGAIGGLGEKGAEAVVPLENNTKWLDKIAEKLSSGKGATYILQVDGKTFGEIVCDSLNDLARNNGSLPLKVY